MDRANGIFPPENEEEETKLPYKELDMKIRCGVRLVRKPQSLCYRLRSLP
ncbi:hypothetical protein T4A_10145 [Trichinella pseudospiralis]|uniref:Uncharacterized protein n=1 Tax=Trichinella pseudospiralis TaxID=6337 RepID=A0A0V1DU58_TRIPS|nr:hypothetical protein T4A_10145 [Trichinella pseudospiralis]